MVQASRRKYHYIYKTTCLVTDKFYIGMHSTDDLEDGYLGSGKQLWYSIKKHGKENHKQEILEFLDNRAHLKIREKELVTESVISNPLCMNLIIGGNATPKQPSLETGKKISTALKGRKRPDISAALKGRKNPKQAEKLRGRKNPEHSERMKGRIPWMKGKKHTEEARKKIGEKQLGNKKAAGKRTPEQRARIAEATRKAMEDPKIRRKCGRHHIVHEVSGWGYNHPMVTRPKKTRKTVPVKDEEDWICKMHNLSVDFRKKKYVNEDGELGYGTYFGCPKMSECGYYVSLETEKRPFERPLVDETGKRIGFEPR